MSQKTALQDLSKLSDEEADVLNNDPELLSAFKQKHGLDQPQQKKSLLKKGWEALTLPEKAAQYVIPKLTQFQSNIQNKLAQKTGLPIGEEPTGNLPRDIAANVPRIMGETGEKVLPGFVSRGAILTAGALKAAGALRPLASIARKGALATLEKTSGIAPRQAGALEEAYQDPTLIFSSGKKAAGKFYEAAKTAAKEVSEEATALVRPDRAPKVIAEAVQKANAGALKPIEALKARKAVDAVLPSKTYLKDDLLPLRSSFDKIAKTDPLIAKADALYVRGIKASAIRQLLPTNVGGTFSSFRTGIGGAAAAMIPGGKVIAPVALSPFVQGIGATALGAASKLATPVLQNAGKVGSTIAAVVKTLTEDKARQMALNDGYEIPE